MQPFAYQVNSTAVHSLGAIEGATSYDILRSKGVIVGKRDFLGKLRLKKPG
jgi:hypothetical protein